MEGNLIRKRGQKGQAMVEFILGAAFATVLVLLCFGKSSWFPGSLKTIYARTWAVLDENPSYGNLLANYGTAPLSEVTKLDNAQRVAADREALANLGRPFLGKTLAEVKQLMNLSGPSESNLYYNPALERNQGTLLYDYDIRNPSDGLASGEVWTKFSNGRTAPENMIRWMQGDYDHNNTKNRSNQLEQNTRYFFSDDMIYAAGVVGDEGADGGAYNASIRITFTFDEEHRVDSARLWTTRNQKQANGKWRRAPCDDLLDVIVTK